MFSLATRSRCSSTDSSGRRRRAASRAACRAGGGGGPRPVVGQLQAGAEVGADGAQQGELGEVALVHRHQQRLLLAGELDVGPRGVELGADAGVLLVEGELAQLLEQVDVGADLVDARRAAAERDVERGDRGGDAVLDAALVLLGDLDPGARRLVAAPARRGR